MNHFVSIKLAIWSRLNEVSLSCWPICVVKIFRLNLTVKNSKHFHWWYSCWCLKSNFLLHAQLQWQNSKHPATCEERTSSKNAKKKLSFICGFTVSHWLNKHSDSKLSSHHSLRPAYWKSCIFYVLLRFLVFSAVVVSLQLTKESSQYERYFTQRYPTLSQLTLGGVLLNSSCYIVRYLNSFWLQNPMELALI